MTTRRRRKLRLVFLVFLVPLLLAAQEKDVSVSRAAIGGDSLILIKGVTRAIIVGTNDSPVEQYAAKELQRAIQIMTGVRLEIRDASTTKSPRIVIGSPGINKEIASEAAFLKLNGSSNEQITVARKGNSIFLAGNSPRAALYATYKFLEDVLGARWLWPGESGEFLPKYESISVGNLFLSEIPAIPWRSLAITGAPGGDPDVDTWMARNRMNNISVSPRINPNDEKSKARRQKGFVSHISGHNIVLPDSLLKKHPEYIAELGGKREFQPGGAVQLCWSNPGVQDAVAKMMASWWDENPYIDAIRFYPADNQRYCQCDECKAMGDVSTRWQKFSSAIMAKVEKVHPGGKYMTYAYQGYKAVPQTQPAPFDYVGYTLYDASYRHLLSGGNKYNQLPTDEINGWLSKGARLGIRGYEYIIFKDPMFVPLVSWVVDEMSWIKRKGLIAYTSELPPYDSPRNALPENTYWNGSRMSLYAAAKAMWNTSLSADSIVKDWCSTVYGPAAAPMTAYYWQMDKAWRSADGKISLYTNSPAPEVDKFLSPELFDKANDYFTEARTKIESITDVEKRNRINEQITLESKMLANWQKVYRYKKNLAGRYRTEIVKSSTNQIDGDMKLPAFETKDEKAALNATNVSMTWTNNALSLHIACKAENASRVKPFKHDANIMDDDAIVIFIQPDASQSSVMQFALNAKGTTYDAISNGGYDFDTSWNPEWTTISSAEKKSWTATVQIPFTTLGLTAKDSVQFRMAIKRTGNAANEFSGWPDASTFNPGNFAAVTLVKERKDNLDNRIILYDANVDGGNLSVEFQEQGWNVAAGVSNEKELKEKLQEDAGTLLLRYDKSWNLSDGFLSKEINDYLKKGRVVVITATNDLPVEKWFDVPAVKWTGNKNTPTRRSSFVLDAGWLDRPNKLAAVFGRSLTPQSAFVPSTQGWTVVSKINLKDGTSQPFLLTKQVGKGLLVLTTSFMGYNGGYEMFGSRNMGNVVRLMGNLKVLQQSGFNGTISH
ncbi:MAG: DUF4838 domain-containing protein [Flavisolibacter sp.]